jgi:hypothetical protein
VVSNQTWIVQWEFPSFPQVYLVCFVFVFLVFPPHFSPETYFSKDNWFALLVESKSAKAWFNSQEPFESCSWTIALRERVGLDVLVVKDEEEEGTEGGWAEEGAEAVVEVGVVVEVVVEVVELVGVVVEVVELVGVVVEGIVVVEVEEEVEFEGGEEDDFLGGKAGFVGMGGGVYFSTAGFGAGFGGSFTIKIK